MVANALRFPSCLQLRRELSDWRFDSNSSWLEEINKKRAANEKTVAAMADDDATPLNYYAAYKPIRDFTRRHDLIVVNEGERALARLGVCTRRF